MKPFILILFIVLTCRELAAQSGVLDPTFGLGGKVTTDVDQTRNVTNSVLVQPDGKVVVIGYCTPIDYSGYFTIVRYNKNGTLDGTFGQGGIVKTVIALDEDIPFSGVIQPDGKIIAAGYSWSGTDYDFAMVRYNEDGTKDLTFGTNGIVTTDFNNSNDKGNKIILQPNGKIILAGYTDDPANYDVNMALARYEGNGKLDLGFGSSGKFILSIGGLGFWQSFRSVALQADGKIVAVGYTETKNETSGVLNDLFAIVRVTGDGVIDNTFGNNGVITTAVGKDDVATAIVVQNDGKLIVSGESKAEKYGYTDFAIVRYKINGDIDEDFGSGGKILTSFDNTDDSGSDMIIQSDQKIIVAGFVARNNGSTIDFAMARYNTNGSLDNTFGNGGKVITDFAGNWDFGTSIAMQKNGSIFLAGYTKSGADYNFGLAKYINDTALPVKLISFDAHQIEKRVLLHWKTATEIYSSHFEIERSPDGKEWQLIGSVSAAGSSDSVKTYVFNDSSPIRGRNLYRLKMVDQDKAYTYGRIKSVDLRQDQADSQIAIYPNPAVDWIHLDMEDQTNFESIRINDIFGRQRLILYSPVKELDVRGLSVGQYLVIIRKKDGEEFVTKVVVQK